MEASFVRSLNFQARDASNESAALQSAFRIGLLDALAVEGAGAGNTIPELAAELGCLERGIRALVEIHAGLGIVRMQDGRYWLAKTHRPVIEDRSIRALLDAAAAVWPATAKLTEAIRTGEPVRVGEKQFDLLGWYLRCFGEAPTADPVGDYLDRFQNNFLRTRALIAAGELGALERVCQGEVPLDALARDIGASARGTGVLARVLESMGLIAFGDQNRVSLTQQASKALEGGSLAYFLRALPATDVYWEGLSDLDNAVRRGEYVLNLRDPEIAQRVYSENASRITGIFEAHLRLGRSGARIVNQLRSLSGARVLDIGTGSGVWGASFADIEPTVSVTYVDLPHVLESVRQNLTERKLIERAKFWATDCIRADYGVSEYDVVVLPQIIPVVPPEQLMGFLRRAVRSLRPSGILAISGYVLNDDRSGPMDALYFSLRRFLTNEGDVFSLPEFTGMLAEMGLPKVRLFELPIQQFVVATNAEQPLPPALERVARRAPNAAV